MSYGNFIKVEGPSAGQLWKRLELGQTQGRSEAWLRDALRDHPELVPVDEIDPTFGPLINVCTELPTERGPIDNVFISPLGRLTLVECKLWKNTESRRKVVGQIIDYASEVAKWSYSDLQSKVNSRIGKAGNHLYDLVRVRHPQLAEARFVDATNAALKEARFLLLLAGDGIRSEVEKMGDLLKKNAGAAYSFGMFEVALYGNATGEVLAQPRLLAITQKIERVVVVVRGAKVDPFGADETATDEEQAPSSQKIVADTIHDAARDWFAPVVSAAFTDPNQVPPRYYWPNNVRAALPWPGTWILGYKTSGPTSAVGVAVRGRKDPAAQVLAALYGERANLQQELPPGTVVTETQIGIERPMSGFLTDSEARKWLIDTMNAFVTAVRPRVVALAGEGQ